MGDDLREQDDQGSLLRESRSKSSFQHAYTLPGDADAANDTVVAVVDLNGVAIDFMTPGPACPGNSTTITVANEPPGVAARPDQRMAAASPVASKAR